MQIDCEMAGLDLERDALIEVVTLVTDKDPNMLGENVDVLIRPIDGQLAEMSDFIHEMYIKSGPLDALVGGTTMEEATRTVLDYAREFVPTARKVLLTGNIIGMDHVFLARDMSELETHVHYRNVDVSSLKEPARRWPPRVLYQTFAKQGSHRALADTQESIEELRYYHEAIFVAPPGPTTSQAR